MNGPFTVAYYSSSSNDAVFEVMRLLDSIPELESILQEFEDLPTDERTEEKADAIIKMAMEHKV